ncbi:Hypothetical protein, putative, partial [Bodo saltans]
SNLLSSLLHSFQGVNDILRRQLPLLSHHHGSGGGDVLVRAFLALMGASFNNNIGTTSSSAALLQFSEAVFQQQDEERGPMCCSVQEMGGMCAVAASLLLREVATETPTTLQQLHTQPSLLLTSIVKSCTDWMKRRGHSSPTAQTQHATLWVSYVLDVVVHHLGNNNNVLHPPPATIFTATQVKAIETRNSGREGEELKENQHVATTCEHLARLCIAVMMAPAQHNEVTCDASVTALVHAALRRSLATVARMLPAATLQRIAETFLRRLTSFSRLQVMDETPSAVGNHEQIIAESFFGTLAFDCGAHIPQTQRYFEALRDKLADHNDHNAPLHKSGTNPAASQLSLLDDISIALQYLNGRHSHSQTENPPAIPKLRQKIVPLSALLATILAPRSSSSIDEIHLLMETWDSDGIALLSTTTTPDDDNDVVSGTASLSHMILQQRGPMEVQKLLQLLLCALCTKKERATPSIIGASIVEGILRRGGGVHRSAFSPLWCPPLGSMISVVLGDTSWCRSLDGETRRKIVQSFAQAAVKACSHDPEQLIHAVGAAVTLLAAEHNDTPVSLHGWSLFLRSVAHNSAAISNTFMMEVLQQLGSHAPPWFLTTALQSISLNDEQTTRWQVDVAFSLPSVASGSNTRGINTLYPCTILPQQQPAHGTPQQVAHSDRQHTIAASQWAAAVALLQAGMVGHRRGVRASDRSASLLFVRRSAAAVLQSIVESEALAASDLLDDLTLRLGRDFGVFPSVTMPPASTSDNAPSNTAILQRLSSPGSASARDVLTNLVLEQRGDWSEQTWRRAVELLVRDRHQQQHQHHDEPPSSLHKEVLRRVSGASWFGAATVFNALAFVTNGERSRPAPLSFSASTAMIMFQQFSRAGAWYCALALASALDTRPRLSPRAWPSEAAYTSCLTACRVAQKWDAAIRVFDDLFQKSHHTPPGAVSSTNIAPSDATNNGILLQRHRPRVVAMQFAHVAEFVATLIAPNSPATAVHVCLQHFQKGIMSDTRRRPNSAASSHLRALLQLLGGHRQDPQLEEGGGNSAPSSRHVTSSALEIFMVTLDASSAPQTSDAAAAPNHNSSISSVMVWQTALSVFSDAMSQHLSPDDVTNKGVVLPSDRAIMSLLSILRKGQRWEEAVAVYQVAKHLHSLNSHQSRRGQGSGDSAVWQQQQKYPFVLKNAQRGGLYQVVATLARHAGGWRAAVSLLEQEFTEVQRTMKRLPHLSSTNVVVDVRTLDRVLHSVLTHSAPTQWVLALQLLKKSADIAEVGGSSPKYAQPQGQRRHRTSDHHHRRGNSSAPPVLRYEGLMLASIPSHTAELLVYSRDVPMGLRRACFDLLIQRQVLPVALTHGASKMVLALVHDINQQPSSTASASSGMGAFLLRQGIRNADTRVKQLYDHHHAQSSSLPRETALRFLRCYYEAFAQQWALSATGDSTKGSSHAATIVDSSTAAAAMQRLVDVWQEQQRTLPVAGSSSAPPSISIAALEHVAVVFRDIAGDIEKADHIFAWIASSQGQL